MPSLQKNTTKLISSAVLLTYLAVVICSPLTYASAQEEGLYFIHTDHLGSTTVITDKDGEVVQHTRNYPYGADRATQEDSNAVTERKFTGQIRDSSTSLYYYNARYYDPGLGTFISADTVNDSLNRFSYVRGNPIMNTDPTGHMVDTRGAGFGYDRDGEPGATFGEKMRATWQAISPSYNSVRAQSFSDVWEDIGRPWYLRETFTGKVMGDVVDIGKGVAVGVALQGANAALAGIRSNIAANQNLKNLAEGVVPSEYKKLTDSSSEAMQSLFSQAKDLMSQVGLSKSEAVYEVVTQNIKYTQDAKLLSLADQASDLTTMLETTGGYGTCRHQAVVGTSLMRMLGEEAYFSGYDYANVNFGHAVTAVKTNAGADIIDFSRGIDSYTNYTKYITKDPLIDEETFRIWTGE